MSLVHSIGRLLFFQSSDRESLLVEKVGALFVSRYTTRGWIFEGRQSRHLLLQFRCQQIACKGAAPFGNPESAIFHSEHACLGHVE